MVRCSQTVAGAGLAESASDLSISKHLTCPGWLDAADNTGLIQGWCVEVRNTCESRCYALPSKSIPAAGERPHAVATSNVPPQRLHLLIPTQKQFWGSHPDKHLDFST